MNAGGQATSRWRHAGALWVAGICALVALAYGQYLNMPLYADDYRWLRWTTELLADPHALLVVEAAMFRFILKILYAPMWLLFGTNPVPYHLVDLALIWASVGLALRFYRQLGLGLTAAGMATLLHIMHPAHPGSFLICGSTTGLLGWVLYLLAAICYVGFRRHGRMRDWWCAFACYAIGLAVKEDLVTLPVLLVLYDVLMRREQSWPVTLTGIVRRLTPFFALLVILLGAQWSVQRATYFVAENNYAPAYIPGNYAKMLVAQVHPWWKQAPIKYLDLALYALALAGLVRGGRRLRFFIGWLFVSYVPYALLAWGHEDRFFLIPSFGLAGVFGIWVERQVTAQRRQRVLLAGLAVAALAFIGINRGPLTEWYTTEAGRAASFVKIVRKATRPGQQFQLINEPALKFVFPDFIVPVEFPDGRVCRKVESAAADPRQLQVFWRENGFDLLSPGMTVGQSPKSPPGASEKDETADSGARYMPKMYPGILPGQSVCSFGRDTEWLRNMEELP